MGKKILFLLSFLSIQINASFVGLTDSTTQERFLGTATSTCDTSNRDCRPQSDLIWDSANNVGTVFKTFEIGNLVGLNVLQEPNCFEMFNFFNDFLYWGQQRAQAYNNYITNLRLSDDEATDKIKKDWPGAGVYQVILSALDFVVDQIYPGISCSDGKKPVAAILKYNNGQSIETLDVHCICMSSSDSFTLDISDQQHPDQWTHVKTGDTQFSNIVAGKSNDSIKGVPRGIQIKIKE